MATRMVGGFILVAFLLCILLAWPGRRRWPVWLIGGLSSSICAALALSLSPTHAPRLPWARLAAALLGSCFFASPAAPELRCPLRQSGTRPVRLTIPHS